MARVGLAVGKCISAANCGKTLRFSHGLEKTQRKSLEFIRAYGKFIAIGCETIECIENTGKEDRLPRYICCIMGAEFLDEMIEHDVIDMLLLRCKGAFDHDASALSHETTQRYGIGSFQTRY